MAIGMRVLARSDGLLLKLSCILNECARPAACMRLDVCVRKENSTDSDTALVDMMVVEPASLARDYLNWFRSSELQSDAYFCGLGEAHAGRVRHAVYVP